MVARFDSRPLVSRRRQTTRRELRVPPPPPRSPWLHTAHLLCVIGAAVIARNVANQEILLAIGPRILGEAYVAVSIITGLSLSIVGAFAKNMNPSAAARMTHGMVAIAIGAAYFASWAMPEVHGVLVAKYVTMEIGSAMTLLTFGLVLGARLGPRDARRNASKIGVGGIVGGLLGGMVLREGAPILGSANLYPVAIVFSVAPILFLPSVARKSAKQPEAKPPNQANVKALAPYGRWVSITTLLMATTTSVIDFQYRATASSWYPSDDMTSFFGSVTVLAGLTTLVLQLTVVERLLTKVGLFAAASVMPSALLLCSGFFGIFPGAISLIVLKLVDSGTNMSVQQAAGALLLAPLSVQARAVWQSRIDGFAKRGGQAIAGVYLASTSWSPVRLVPIVLVLCAIWLIAVLITRVRYVGLLTGLLGATTSHEPEVVTLDRDTSRMLLNELSRATPARAAVILDLLENAGQRAPDEHLFKLADHDPSAALRVVEHLEILQDVDGLSRFSSHRDPNIAGKALLSLIDVAPQIAVRRSREMLYGKAAEPVRALAAGVLLERDAEAMPIYQTLLRSTRATTRVAAARALQYGLCTNSVFIDRTLSELAQDQNAKVANAALHTLADHPSSKAIDIAIQSLGRRDTRGAAMRTLADIGYVAGNSVVKELQRHKSNPDLASSLMWILGRIASRPSRDALIEALGTDRIETRLSAAVSLNTLKRSHPKLEIPMKPIEEHYDREIEYLRVVHHAYHAGLPDSPAGRLLRRALRQRADASLECLFRLLALHHPEASIQGAFSGLSSKDARQREIAFELLHTVVAPGIGAALARVVSDPGHKVSRAERKNALQRVVGLQDRFLNGLTRLVLVELGIAPPNARGDPMTQSLINQVLELQSLSLFSRSSAEDLAEVAAVVRAETLAENAQLYREGDAPDSGYLIRSGAVTITSDSQEIARLGPGDACGFVGILDQLPREATAQTVSECSVYVIKSEELVQLLADRPLLMHSMFRALTQSIRNTAERIALERRDL